MLRSKFAKDVDFPTARVAVNAGGLLIGSIETTSQAVAQVIEYFLVQRRTCSMTSRRRCSPTRAHSIHGLGSPALRADQPLHVPAIGGELRHRQGTNRSTLVPAGTNVLLLTQSAMFDLTPMTIRMSSIPIETGITTSISGSARTNVSENMSAWF
jgi:hypothetical protein